MFFPNFKHDINHWSFIYTKNESNSKIFLTALFSLERKWKKLFLHWGQVNTFAIQLQHIVWPQWLRILGVFTSILYTSKHITHSSAFSTSMSFLASITSLIWKLSNSSFFITLPQLSCWHVWLSFFKKHPLQIVWPQSINKIGLCSTLSYGLLHNAHLSVPLTSVNIFVSFSVSFPNRRIDEYRSWNSGSSENERKAIS